MKLIIEYLDFRKFEKELIILRPDVPDIEEYESRYLTTYESGINLKGTSSEIRKILPLKSLVITREWRMLNEVVVKFDNSELMDRVNNKIYKSLALFIDNYFDLKFKGRFQYYKNTKESVELFIDAIKCDYHLESEDEVLKLIKYLDSEINGFNDNGVDKEDVKKRMRLELEYIDLQNEKRKSFNFN